MKKPLVGVENQPEPKKQSTKFESHSKVSLALTLLALTMVFPPAPTMAEESSAISGVQPKTSNVKRKITPLKKYRNADQEKKSDKDSSIETSANSVDAKNTSTISSTSGTNNPDKFTEDEIIGNADLSQNEAIGHFEAARYYMSNWDMELAEVELRAAIMYMPDMKVAHRDYCLVAVMRGKPLRALAEFMMVVGLGEPIPLNEDQQTNLREEASGVHYNKGLSLAAENKWKESVSELLWSRKYTPLDPVVHRSLAFAYAGSKQFDKAQEHYQRALELNPDDAMARADYAVMLSGKGDKDSAFAEMVQAVRSRPDAAALHVDLAYMAESKSDFATAAKELRQAIELSPGHSILWSQLGQVLVKAGEIDSAKSAFKKALKLDATNLTAQAELTKLTKTEIESESGDNVEKASDSNQESSKDTKVAEEEKLKSNSKNRKITPLKRQ